MSNSGSGTPSEAAGPSGSGSPLSEATARRLVVALELVARKYQVSSGAASTFANRDRTAAGQPHPAEPFLSVAPAAPPAAPPPKPILGPAFTGPAPSPAAPPKPILGPAFTEPVTPVPPLAPAVAPGATPGGPCPVVVVDWTVGKAIDVGVTRGGLAPAGKPSKAGSDPQESGKASGWASVANSAGGALLKAFAPVLGPMYAFGAVLSQTNSGMSTLQKAVNVMAATLAPILLPPMLIMSAVILSLSDIVWSKLRPNLAGIASVFGAMVPAIEAAINSLADLVDAIAYVVEVAKDPSKLVRGTDAERADQARNAAAAPPGTAGVKAGTTLTDFAAAGFNPFTFIKNRVTGNDATSRLNAGVQAGQPPAPPPGSQPATGETPGAPVRPGDRLRQSVADARAAREAPRPPGGTPGAPAGMASAFDDNLNLVMASLTKAMGPKAEYTSAAGAAKARQLAGANGDPLDMKALLRALESLREVTTGVRAGVDRLNGDQPTPQVPPNGRGG